MHRLCGKSLASRRLPLPLGWRRGNVCDIQIDKVDNRQTASLQTLNEDASPEGNVTAREAGSADHLTLWRVLRGCQCFSPTPRP